MKSKYFQLFLCLYESKYHNFVSVVDGLPLVTITCGLTRPSTNQRGNSSPMKWCGYLCTKRCHLTWSLTSAGSLICQPTAKAAPWVPRRNTCTSASSELTRLPASSQGCQTKLHGKVLASFPWSPTLLNHLSLSWSQFGLTRYLFVLINWAWLLIEFFSDQPHPNDRPAPRPKGKVRDDDSSSCKMESSKGSQKRLAAQLAVIKVPPAVKVKKS